MKKEIIPNCKKITEDDVDFVICSPEKLEGEMRIPIGKISFRDLGDGTLELIDTKRMDAETTEEVKKYLEELGFKIKL